MLHWIIMSLSLQKSLILLFGTTLLGLTMPSATMAVDNLESGSDLTHASLMGAFMRDSFFSESDLKTELLAVCSPAEGCLGIVDYCLDAPQQIALCVYDQTGREVAELVDRTEVSGSHTVRWDGCCKDGVDAPDGTYFIMMKTDESVFLRRMVLDR